MTAESVRPGYRPGPPDPKPQVRALGTPVLSLRQAPAMKAAIVALYAMKATFIALGPTVLQSQRTGSVAGSSGQLDRGAGRHEGHRRCQDGYGEHDEGDHRPRHPEQSAGRPDEQRH